MKTPHHIGCGVTDQNVCTCGGIRVSEPDAPCVKCGGPIDEHIKALTDGIRTRRGLPVKAPKLCTKCAWLALTTLPESEGTDG